MNEFSKLLRNFRESCHDPIFSARRLSQQKFGELLGNELGAQGYSGAAVSDWERGRSKIHADDRLVLAAIISVLHEAGGLKTINDANQLLEAGNYRALDEGEKQKIFKESVNDAGVKASAPEDQNQKSVLPLLLENFFSVSQEELRDITAKAEDGPPPSWPRILAALLHKASDGFSITLTTIGWIWVWLIDWWLMAPSLRLPFANEAATIIAMQRYILGTLIVPLLIGLLVDTKNNEYWKRQPKVNPLLLRLYTYQGAGIGFNLGYFFVFPFSLARFYLHLDSVVWVEIAAATLALILGNMGAHVVPHNLWLAYGRLKFSDGAIFFVVALVGPFWGFFFLEFYPILLTPVLGILMILLGVSFTVIITKRRSKKQIC